MTSRCDPRLDEARVELGRRGADYVRLRFVHPWMNIAARSVLGTGPNGIPTVTTHLRHKHYSARLRLSPERADTAPLTCTHVAPLLKWRLPNQPNQV